MPMIDERSLIRWLKGADEIFEALESRGDAYNLCRRWVEEWFSYGKFCITNEDKNFLKEFELLIFNERVKSKIENSLAQLKEKLENHTEDIAFAFSLYLISWNIRRFETYFKRNNDFSFEDFFVSLNKVFNGTFLDNVKNLRKQHLFKNEVKDELIADIYKKLEEKIKQIVSTQNEPVATIKIMHIIAPYYIPLLDNPIAKALKREKLCDFFNFIPPSRDFWKNLKKLKNGKLKLYEMKKIIQDMLDDFESVKLDIEAFLNYIKWIRKEFNKFKDVIYKIEKDTQKSFLKLLDQAFYIRYSIDIGRRLK